MADHQSDHETRMREGAYKLRKENDRPHGRDVELWEQARDLVAMDENPEADRLPKPTDADPARRASRKRTFKRIMGICRGA